MRGQPLSCDQPYISLPESAAVLLWCRKPVLQAPNAPSRIQRAVWGPPCVDRRAGTPQTASQASLGFRPEAWVHKAHTKRRSHPSPARIGQVGPFQPTTEIAFWKPSETAVVGQILAGSLVEADFDNLDIFWAVLGLFLALLQLFLLLEPFWAVMSLFQPVLAPGGTPRDAPAKSLGLGFILC